MQNKPVPPQVFTGAEASIRIHYLLSKPSGPTKKAVFMNSYAFLVQPDFRGEHTLKGHKDTEYVSTEIKLELFLIS